MALVAAAAGLLVAIIAMAVSALVGPVSGPLAIAFLCGTLAALAAAGPAASLFALLDDIVRVRARLEEQLRERQRTESRLRRLAEIDDLTGLLNRRAFFKRADGILALARRYDHSLSVAIVDIDNFKTVNDRHGHAAGDRALIEVADAVRREARTSDVVARLGGDEFVVLMPMTALEGARRMAERLRQRLMHERSLPFTVSVGLAAAKGPEADLETLLSQADRMLYAAKAAGRDRVFPPEDEPSFRSA